MINCSLVNTVLGLRRLYALAKAVAEATDLRAAALSGHALGVNMTGYGRGRQPTVEGAHQCSGTVGMNATCEGSFVCAEGDVNVLPAESKQVL